MKRQAHPLQKTLVAAALAVATMGSYEHSPSHSIGRHQSTTGASLCGPRRGAVSAIRPFALSGRLGVRRLKNERWG